MYLKYSVAVAASALTATFFLASASAQISDGVANSSARSIPAKSPAAIEEEFQSLLARTLSFENVRIVSEMTDKLSRELSQAPLLTDFDDVSAPCFFASTTPLHGLHQNAYFTGFGGNGGGIINQCGGFGLDAYSQPNFLAFNQIDGIYGNAAKAMLPELFAIRSDGTTVSSVSFYVSGGNAPGYPLAAIAFGDHAVKGIVSTTLTDGWVQLFLRTPGIQSVLLVSNTPYLVVDNIQEQ